MQLGMIGLGRMGANMVRRLMKAGHQCAVYDTHPDAVKAMSDSGEGRWTVRAAVDTGVPAQVLTAALFERFSSRGEGDFANRLLSAMRSEFGGHAEKPAGH